MTVAHGRAASDDARLARLGFVEPERALAELETLRLDAGDPLLAELARAADPDLALSALAGMAAPELLPALRRDELLRSRLFAVLGASTAFGTHLSRYPQDWRLLTGGRSFDRVSEVGSPADAESLRVAHRRGLLRIAARDLSGRDQRRGRRRRAVRPGGLGAAGRSGVWSPRSSNSPPAAGARRRRRSRSAAARGHRDGQVRRPGTQLRQRRRRDLRVRRRRGAAAARHQARRGHGPDLHRRDQRGHAVRARRRPAAGGPAGRAGPHHRQLRGVLPPLGTHLGVPGAAQGAAGRRQSRHRLAVRRPRRADGVDGRGASRTSSPTCRRCAAGSSACCRRPAPNATSSLAAADCETSNSPCSCCNSCTAGRMSGYASRQRSARSGRSQPVATSAGRTQSSWRPPTASCARWSTACSCIGCSAPIPSRAIRSRCAGSAAPSDCLATPPRRWSKPAAAHAREVRRLHEKLFYRPLLEAVARLPADESPAVPGGGPEPAAGLGFPGHGFRSQAPGGADPRGKSDRSDPADAAARHARVVRRRRRPGRRAARVPAGERGARQHPLVPAVAARRGRARQPGGRAARAAAGDQPVPRDDAVRSARGSGDGAQRRGVAAAQSRAGRGGAARRSYAATTSGRRRSRRHAECAGWNSYGSRPPTCSACSLPSRSAGACPTRPTRRSRRRCRSPLARWRSSGADRCRSNSPSSRWAGSAAVSSGTAATPT